MTAEFSETYQMAVLADSYGVQMAPHGWLGPVAVRAATHVLRRDSQLAGAGVSRLKARPRLDPGVD